MDMHIFSRDEDIRIMGQRGEFRGNYKIGVTNGEQFRNTIYMTL